MAFSTKVGAFNTTTAAATNTVAVTGVGFVPKAIIFWWAGLVATTDTFSGADVNRGLGVATSTTSRWVVSSRSSDGAAQGDSDRMHRNDACIATIINPTAVDGLMDLQSFDADGFTLVIDQAFTTSKRIHYLALGGADLTNASTGTFSEPAATGTQDTTSAGFQPDFVLFGSVGTTTAINNVVVSGVLMVGAAASSTQEAVTLNIALDAVDPTDTSAYSRAGDSVASGVGPTARAEFDSFLSNGFRLNWLERAATGRIFLYLALKGGQYRVNDFLTSTTPAATITETGFGFAPKGTLLFSHGRAADTSDVATAHDQWNVGAFTSTTERGAQGILDVDNVASVQAEVYVEHDVALAQTTATPTLVGLVDVQSIDSDGFTLVMDSAASTPAFVWYASFGDTSGGATQNLTGSLFTKAPTFFTGAVTATYALTGNLFTKAPTFPTGTVTATYALTGTLFTKAPTFPQGAVTTGALILTGTLFTNTPTFPQGVITTGGVTLTGVLFQNTPTFPTGVVTAGAINLTGTLYVNTPIFPTGTIGQAGTLFGTLYVNTPVFFTGSLAQGGPSFWMPNPAAYVGVTRYGPSPWGAELSGQRFEKAPTFPVGAVS